MKQRLVFGGGVALVIAVAVLVNCRTVRAPSAPPAQPVANAPSPGPAMEPAKPVEAAPPSIAAPAPRVTPQDAAQSSAQTGAERLTQRRNLSRPPTTPALEAMKQFDRDEMLLLAQIQKRMKRAPPSAVKEIIDARRSGSSFEELWALADQKLAGDAEMLLAVRGWLNEVLRPADAGSAAGPGAPDAPKGTPLELGGTVTPAK